MNQDVTRADNDKPLRLADFETLTKALEHAESEMAGYNFIRANQPVRKAP